MIIHGLKAAMRPRGVQNAAAWRAWRGAARRLKSIGRQLKAQAELRHIRVHVNGYQVVFNSRYNYLSRCFAGFSEESLERAKAFRDKMLRQRAGKRKNHVPRAVLGPLGLSQEVRGISRLASRSVYRVKDRAPDGRVRWKQFYFRRVPEVDAYAAAIEFLKKRNAKGGARNAKCNGPRSKVTQERKGRKPEGLAAF